jgi:hypothetical protein
MLKYEDATKSLLLPCLCIYKHHDSKYASMETVDGFIEQLKV